MIINQKQSEIEILETGNNDTIDMSLDMDSAHILMNMLSKNLYSDAIGSAIRETVSNSLDSHRRSKCKKAIIVSLKENEEGNLEFSSEDFGTGLDDGDIRNIISKYGMSTKRQEANSLGAMGLGFKSPLAYSSSFYFVCRKNGMERKYLMYENENGNSIDLLYESPTTECNGVKVIIPVKYVDRWNFFNKIQEQLAYFENVYFDVLVGESTIDNEFSIYRADNYQFSSLASDGYMHICLDDVYYPLDFSKLGISRINIPIGLRFGLSDGLFPIPSREALLYNNKTKEIILNKIKSISEEFIIKYNNSIEETENIQEIFKYYNTSSKYINIRDSSFDVTILSDYSTININTPKLKNVSLLNLKTIYSNRDYIFGEYKLRYTMYNNRFQENKNYSFRDIQPMSLNKRNYYIYDETIPGNKKTYFRETLDSSNYYFVKKFKNFRLFKYDKYDGYNNYYDILDLQRYPKEQWRQVIKEFQYVQSLLLENFINVNNFVIPQEWHDARKKKRVSISSGGTRKVKLQGEITCKLAVPLLKSNGNNCKFVSETYKLEDLHKQKCLFVYTKHDNASNLDKLFEISKKQSMRFITFSDQTLKVVQKLNIHNLISYEKFMEGKNAPFKRIVTSYVIKQLKDENDSLFGNLDVIKLISESLYTKLNNLYEYERHNYVYSSDSAITAMLEVATNNNLFDENIYPEYLEMKALLEKLPFIDIIIGKMSRYSKKEDELFPILIDMFKYYKKRIDYKHYNIKLNEEVLTNETIEELI
jgi:hypothetical protein